MTYEGDAYLSWVNGRSWPFKMYGLISTTPLNSPHTSLLSSQHLMHNFDFQIITPSAGALYCFCSQLYVESRRCALMCDECLDSVFYELVAALLVPEAAH